MWRVPDMAYYGSIKAGGNENPIDCHWDNLRAHGSIVFIVGMALLFFGNRKKSASKSQD
jgi:hypothetical protein